MSSEKQLILIILGAIVCWCVHLYKEKKRKNNYYEKYRKSQGWE
jgi:hypothetical protein